MVFRKRHIKYIVCNETFTFTTNASLFRGIEEDKAKDLHLSHTGDMSRYMFALVLHKPTAVQEAKARRLHAAKLEWFES